MGQDDTSKFDGKGPNFSSWTNDEMGVVNFGSPDDKDIKVVNKFVDVQGTGAEATQSSRAKLLQKAPFSSRMREISCP